MQSTVTCHSNDTNKNNIISLTITKLPKIKISDPVTKVIIEISEKRLGVTAVVDTNDSIVGIITDGDIRRMLSKTTKIDKLTANDIMSRNPKTIHIDAMAIDALDTLENNSITQILAIDDTNKYVGVDIISCTHSHKPTQAYDSIQ